MRIPRRAENRRDLGNLVAREDAARLAESAPALLDRALGIEWYEEHGTDVDLAALTLCRLRRASAAEKGGPQHGDASVRETLGQASPEALAWIASRAISYMDETGFPEAVGPWFPDEVTLQ